MNGLEFLKFPDEVMTSAEAYSAALLAGQACGVNAESYIRAAITAHVIRLQAAAVGLAVEAKGGLFVTALAGGLVVVDEYLSKQRRVSLMLTSEFQTYAKSLTGLLAANGVSFQAESLVKEGA